MIISNYKKDVLKLFSANIIMGVISAIAIPIITRIYSPADIGYYQILLSMLLVLTSVCSFKYDFCVIISNDEKEVKAHSIIALIILTVSCCILSLLLFVFDDVVRDWFGFEIRYINAVLPVALFILGGIQIVNAIATNRRQFTTLSKSKIVNSGVNNGLGVGVGFLYPSTISLLFSFISASLVSMIYLHLKSNRDNQHKLSIIQLKKYAYKRKKITTLTTINSLLNAISMNLPYFLMPKVFNVEQVGLFALALRVLDMPIGLITNSVTNVYTKYAAESYGYSISSLKKKYRETVISLISISGLYCIAVIAFALFFSDLILGDEWLGISNILLIMLFAKVAQLVNSPLSSTLAIIEKQEIGTLLIVVFLILRASSLYSFSSFHITIMAYSTSTAIFYILINYITYKVIK